MPCLLKSSFSAVPSVQMALKVIMKNYRRWREEQGSIWSHFAFLCQDGILRPRPIIFNWLKKQFDSSVHSSNDFFSMLFILIPPL